MIDRVRRSALGRRLQDVALSSRVLVVAALVPLLFRWRLAVVQAVLMPGRTPAARDAVQLQRITRCVRRAQRFGAPVVRPGCLTRASTLFYFLRRAGWDVSLCFGTGQPDGSFAGHCWLELDGEAFLEKREPHPHFQEIFRIPGVAASQERVRQHSVAVQGVS